MAQEPLSQDQLPAGDQEAGAAVIVAVLAGIAQQRAIQSQGRRR